MTEFLRFKSKMTRDAIIKSIAFGLSFGLVAVAVPLTVLKLLGIILDPLWYVLIGVLTSLLTFTVVFLIHRPTDVKVAKELDRTLVLSERVKTMLAFKGKDGAMLEVQREDTEAKLSVIPTRTIKFKRLVATLLVLVLSASLFVGSLFVPVTASEEEPEQPIGDWERQYLLEELRNLIDRVNSPTTFIDDGLKKGSVEILEELVGVVEERELKSEMKDAAILSVLDISELLSYYNTAEPIADCFLESDTDKIVEVGEALKTLTGSTVNKAMRELRDMLTGSSDRNTVTEQFVDEVNAYLRVSGVDAGDNFYMIFRSLTGKISEMDTPDEAGIKEAFAAAEPLISDELLWQRVNKDTMSYVVSKLRALFSITDKDLEEENDGEVDIIEPDEELGEFPEYDDKDEDQLSSDGGYSEGGSVFASDDIIYSPEDKKHLIYSEVIDDYFAKYDKKRQDGFYDEVLKKILSTYFNLLY